MSDVIVGAIYKHYKGNNYRVLALAAHSESAEELVVYRALYGEGEVKARPSAMFTEQLVIEGEITPRFTLVSEGVEVDWEGYQRESRQTAIYPNVGSNPIYPTLGLAGEAGEVANVVKKMWREHEGEIDAEHRKLIAEELGDVLWYMAQLATELHVSLADIVRVNLAKIRARYGNNEVVVKVGDAE